AAATAGPLPLQQALDALQRWQADPTPERVGDVSAAVGRVLSNYGAVGAYLELNAPPLPTLAIGVGSLTRRPAGSEVSLERPLVGAQGAVPLGMIWLAGPAAACEMAAQAIGLAVDAAWSRAEALSAGRRLAALDAAVRGIAGVLALDRVLQLIVDRVRDLSDAQYAALGIVGPDGYLERFITSGIGDEERERIGALPRGRGLLGLIIREGRSFRIDDIATHPQSSGFPAHHPQMTSFLGVPVLSKGSSVGNLYLTNKRGAASFSAADQRLVEMFALHAGIAIDNARLHQEVGRLAVVEDRQRLSQDLHDGIIQSLYAVALSLEDVPDILAEEPAAGSARVDRAIDSIHQTIRDIRNFILGLEPEMYEGADLATGLRSLAAEFGGNTLIDLELHLPDEPPATAPLVTTNLLAMAREALSNIARHSGATRATAGVVANGPTLRLVIGDNGRGFDPGAERTEEHHGLNNLSARAAALGGEVAIESEPGVGTRVVISIPIEAATERPA
ncbi:MAG TPA: GAF domain-containing sensor histidine kinase, partial [Candidatus Limnocylindrales bacterium]